MINLRTQLLVLEERAQSFGLLSDADEAALARVRVLIGAVESILSEKITNLQRIKDAENVQG